MKLTPTPTTTPIPSKEYSHQYFSLIPPKDWTIIEGEQFEVIGYHYYDLGYIKELTFKSPDRKAQISVTVGSVLINEPLANLTPILRIGLPLSYKDLGGKNFTILSEKDRYVAETPTHEFVFTVELGGFPFKLRYIVLISDKGISNKRDFSFVLAANPEYYSTYEPIFEEMLGSIRLK